MQSNRATKPVGGQDYPSGTFPCNADTLALYSLVVFFSQEHLAGHPLFVPRGARKRVLALAELVRLQMKAESDKATTTIDVRRRQPCKNISLSLTCRFKDFGEGSVSGWVCGLRRGE